MYAELNVFGFRKREGLWKKGEARAECDKERQVGEAVKSERSFLKVCQKLERTNTKIGTGFFGLCFQT